MDLLGAYQFLDDRISVLEEDYENCEDCRRHFIGAELDNFKNLKDCIETLRRKATLKNIISKMQLSTNVRITKDNMKDRQHWSGCLEDNEFRKSIERYEDNEVLWFGTCVGWKSLGEEENEPYIEIEIGDETL